MTQGVYCFHNQRHTYYQFTEEDADKSSDEVGTALLDWIMDAKFVKNRPFTQLHIWFDNCAGQNKNFYLVCLLLFVIQMGLVDKIYMEFLVCNFWQHLLINDIVLISFVNYYYLILIEIVYSVISLLITN